MMEFSIFSAIQYGQSRKPLKYILHLKGLPAAPRHKQPHTNKKELLLSLHNNTQNLPTAKPLLPTSHTQLTLAVSSHSHA